MPLGNLAHSEAGYLPFVVSEYSYHHPVVSTFHVPALTEVSDIKTPSINSSDKPMVFIGAKERGFTNNINKNHIKILGNREERFLEAFTRSFKYMNAEAIESSEITDWFTSRLVINPSFISQNENKAYEAVIVLQLIQDLAPNLHLVNKDNTGTQLNIIPQF